MGEPIHDRRTQADRVFDRFGGAKALQKALAALGPEQTRSISALYRWNLPRPVGSGGFVPATAWHDVFEAARLEGVVLTDDVFRVDIRGRGKGLPPIEYFNMAVKPARVADRPAGWQFTDPSAFYRALDDQARTLRSIISAAPADAPDLLEKLGHNFKLIRWETAFQKVPKVVEQLRSELEGGEYGKAIVLATEPEVVAKLYHDLAPKLGAVRVNHNTPAARRTALARQFNEDRACRVLCGDVVAVGLAGALTAASEVVFADADYSTANNAQAVMRAHRRGQPKPVRVRFASVIDSDDRRVQTILMQRTRYLTAPGPN